MPCYLSLAKFIWNFEALQFFKHSFNFNSGKEFCIIFKYWNTQWNIVYGVKQITTTQRRWCVLDVNAFFWNSHPKLPLVKPIECYVFFSEYLSSIVLKYYLLWNYGFIEFESRLFFFFSAWKILLSKTTKNQAWNKWWYILQLTQDYVTPRD